LPEILARSGERTRVIARSFSSVPATISFEAVPLDGGERVGGRVEVIGSRWVFPKQPVVTGLTRHNTVTKGYWDTFYRVFVTADRDVRVVVRRAARSLLPWLLAGLVAVSAAAVVVIALIR
jgi:hypothetical protein